MEQKYVVFKKSDWDEFEKGPWNGYPPHPPQVVDCFVIRFQDVLAGPGLHAYAHAAQTFVEGYRRPPVKNNEELKYREARIENLERVRDAAFEAAQIADEYPNKKVPD